MDKQMHTKRSLTTQLALTVGALTLACLMQGCSPMSQSQQHNTDIFSSPAEEATSPSATDSPAPPSVTDAPDGTTPPSGTESTSKDTQAPQTPAETEPSVTETLRNYYENLIASLRQQLSDEKADRYISDVEYKLKLDELMATVAALEEALEQSNGSEETSTEAETRPSGKPSPTPLPNETTADTEEEKEPVLFTYRVVEGQAHITGYTGDSATVHVPTEIHGYTVVALDDSAFQNSSVKAVVLPGSVTTVGWFAFSGCYGLELVSLPASVTKINYGAFDNCPNLTLLCPADSYAEAYAISFGLAYRYV